MKSVCPNKALKFFPQIRCQAIQNHCFFLEALLQFGVIIYFINGHQIDMWNQSVIPCKHMQTKIINKFHGRVDNTKPICYNIAKKNSHVVLISVSEVFIWQTAKTETSLLTALCAL